MSEVVWAERADAEAVADHVAGVIAVPSGTRLAVPGGRTPVPILEALARRALAWERVSVTLTDDRVVPADHEASNFGMLRRTLGETGAALEGLKVGAAVRRFDLVWFGMGEDGHVASLFPAMAAVTDAAAIVRMTPDPLPPEAPFDRVTLTYRALADCGDMILVIAGEAKRQRLEDALAGDASLPIGRLLALRAAPLTIYWTPA